MIDGKAWLPCTAADFRKLISHESTTLIIAALFCSAAVAAPESVTCDSPCDCHNAHGEGPWSVKTDASLPPTDASAIQAVTPSDMFSWPGPDAKEQKNGRKYMPDYAVWEIHPVMKLNVEPVG